MKSIKLLLTVTILATCSITYPQDTIKIDEVVISREIKIKKLLSKIKSNLVKNCDTANYNFLLYQKSFINADTLLIIDEKIGLQLKSFNNKFEKRYSGSLNSRLVEINKNKFADYIEGSSPLSWISDYPLKKNLNTVNLDFIKNYPNYRYRLEKINEEKSVISFDSDSLYNGKIIFNPKTNMPKSIEYTNSMPYIFSHTNIKNLNSINQFESEWKYILENSVITFCCKDGKLSLQNIEIEETIVDFKYHILNKNKTQTFLDKNNFCTILKLKRVQ